MYIKSNPSVRNHLIYDRHSRHGRILRFLSFWCVLFITCIAPYQAYAEEKELPSNIGYAYFAMQHPAWPCNESLAIFDRSPTTLPRIAMLWNTFGTSRTCLQQFLSRPGKKLLQIHLINEVCSKNERCGSYEFLRDIPIGKLRNLLLSKNQEFLRRFDQYTSEVDRFLSPYYGEDLECLISPLLESTQRDEQASIIIERTRSLFPRCKIVWSALSPHSLAGADFLEGHGETPSLSPPCIANLDGTDAREIDLPRYLSRYEGCHATFLWIKDFNLLRESHEAFIDPRERSQFPVFPMKLP